MGRIAAALLLFLSSCDLQFAKREAPPEAQRSAGVAWPPGLITPDDTAEIRFVLVHLRGDAGRRAPAVLARLVAQHLASFAVSNTATAAAQPDTVELLAAQATPFEPRYLEYHGKGLDAATATALEKERPSTVVRVLASRARLRQALQGIVRAVGAAARELGAVVEDPAARQVLSAAAFADRVVQRGFEGELPLATGHVVIHSYARDDGLLRSVTVGMEKLGLPDVVVNGHTRNSGRSVGNTINLVCQLMIEGKARVSASGELTLDIAQVAATELRTSNLENLGKGGTGKAVLTVASGTREEGDADNRLLELTFGGGAGSVQERQEVVLDRLFGSTDSIKKVRHSAEVEAASARARARLLTTVKPWFAKVDRGLEHLLVKGPFATPSGGKEWMWIEVVGWDGSTIRGILVNDPFEVKALKAGAHVSVREDLVFDYIVEHRDGSQEGNETGKLLE